MIRNQLSIKKMSKYKNKRTKNNEFIQIGSRIRNAVSSAVSAASSFGSNIKNAVLGALGIHSPGIVQIKIATEFENTTEVTSTVDEVEYQNAEKYVEIFADF